MANQKHLNLLKQGGSAWNAWRAQHKEVRPDLSNADLSGAYLLEANLSGADLREANLMGAYLMGANLSRANLNQAKLAQADLMVADLSDAHLYAANLGLANLKGANLSGAYLFLTNLSFAYLIGANLSSANLNNADLSGADLSGADLSGANLSEAHLREVTFRETDLSGADLSGANLNGAILVKTNLTDATLTQCSIYGISVWDVQLEGAKQNNLVITPYDEPTITVDNLEVAQFIYLLLNNPKIRDVIDTIAKTAVLILGRFTPERKAVLDALRDALRARGYLPILFDFDKPSSQDLTETVSTLAHLSRFIIVDLTDPSSAPYEVATIASNHIRPIQALFHPSDEAKRLFAMFPDLIRRYHWVLPPYEYQDQEHLLASLQTKVIEPAEQKAKELEKR
jgi:uncharacterized protein YjbI with pentapeptide repeats